ncbi:hypothetical protein VULLAG_LOCUS15478 [Vulpes lagopus]
MNSAAPIFSLFLPAGGLHSGSAFSAGVSGAESSVHHTRRPMIPLAFSPGDINFNHLTKQELLGWEDFGLLSSMLSTMSFTQA